MTPISDDSECSLKIGSAGISQALAENGTTLLRGGSTIDGDASSPKRQCAPLLLAVGVQIVNFVRPGCACAMTSSATLVGTGRPPSPVRTVRRAWWNLQPAMSPEPVVEPRLEPRKPLPWPMAIGRGKDEQASASRQCLEQVDQGRGQRHFVRGVTPPFSPRGPSRGRRPGRFGPLRLRDLTQALPAQ